MFSRPQIKVILLLSIIACVSLADDDSAADRQIYIGKQKTFELIQSPFKGKYQVKVVASDIPKDQQRWYLFVMAEPLQLSSKMGEPTKIQIFNGEQKIRECNIVQESDSCFIKSNQFDYKKDKISVSVHCIQQCEYHLFAEIDYATKLKINSPFKLDFQHTAYTKLFTLDVTDEIFDELRILLQPRGFISYGEPVILLANYGAAVPTQQLHDFKGIHTWDDGQGIFIRKSDLKENLITILVEGPQKNVLTLTAQGWKKQQRLRPEQYWPEFDWLKSGQTREVLARLNEGLTYRIKVVVFTGGLEFPVLHKLSDDNMTTIPLNFSLPNQKYGEFQFRISKQMIVKQRIKQVVLKIKAKRQSTYVVNYAREQSGISLLLPYVSQSSLMQPKQVDQYFVKVEELIESSVDKKTSKIEIIVGNIQGDVDVTFYNCQSSKMTADNLKNCQITQAKKSSASKVDPVKYENRGGEKRFWFEIAWADYVKKSDRDTAQVIYQLVVLVQNKLTQKQSAYEIQYKNKDRIYLLKQGELVKDRVFINEKRHYKISVSDKDVTEVRIHSTRISGQAFFVGSFVDPRINKDREKIISLYGAITFKIDPEKHVNEVFVEVQGSDNAYYSLTVQMIRKSESINKNNSTGYNELIVNQNIPYEFLIAPLESIVLQIHARQKKFNLDLKSTSAVKVCMTQNLQSPPFSPNCQISNDFFLEMNEQIVMDRGLVGNIGIKNTDSTKNVSIKIKITRLGGGSSGEGSTEGDNETCELGSMNEVMFKRIFENGKDRDGDVKHCVQFNLDKNEELELIVDLRGDHLYDEGNIVASINDQEVIKILSPSHIFTKEQVEKSCSAARSGGQNHFCYLKVKIEGIKNKIVRVMAQYTNSAIRLMDGIAHPVHSRILQNSPKYFFLAIHNAENITILLQNKVGEYKIYASLLPYSQFSEQKYSIDLFPSKEIKDVESSNPFYYLQQIITISKQNITTKCPSERKKVPFGKNWVDCVLLISVYLEGQKEIEYNGKFVIEATQQNRQLREGEQLEGFLQKKSAGFYHFKNEKQNGTILINVNNQNKNCLDIFLREGSERATSQYNEKHAKATNILMYDKAKVGTYSLTLQALENCPFTISVTTSTNRVSKIKKGSFSDINLKNGQSKYFLFENLINETFKVLCLEKSGQVIISVNPIQKSKFQQTLNSNFEDIKDWSWSNKDSVRINNLDSKNEKPNEKYCINCFYLIKVNAQRTTQGSIVIPTPNSQLPITTDSTVKDLLLRNQSVTYRVFAESMSQFQVYVQYGKINIQIVESNKENIIGYNKTFQPSKSAQLETFSLSKGETFEFLRYIKIKIFASQDSYFSFELVSSPDPAKRGTGLKYGIPEYIFLDSNKEKCVNGMMTLKQDQFLLSFPKQQKQTIQKLEMKIKTEGGSLSFDKEIGINQMIVRINGLGGDQQSKKFQYCLKSEKALSITLIQSSPLNYWPEGESILVKAQANLTFGSEGKGVIQLNQCSSRASAEIYPEFNDLKSVSSQIKQRRRTNNIVQFFHYGPVYVKIKGSKVSAKWILVNQTSGDGLAYQQYRSGTLRYQKKGNKLQVNAQFIKPIDEKAVSGTIVGMYYEFYAAKQEMQLYGAMNCGEGQYLYKFVDAGEKEKQKKIASTAFDIQELKEKFGNSNYFLMGAKGVMTVKTQTSTKGYRFFYPYQQISRQLLLSEGEKVRPIDIDDKNQPVEQQQGSIHLIGYAVLGLILLGVCYFIYNKYLSKCLKKQKKDDSMGREMKYFDLSETH